MALFEAFMPDHVHIEVGVCMTLYVCSCAWITRYVAVKLGHWRKRI